MSTGRVQGPLDGVPGVTRVVLPIEVNAIESVNMYVIDDGEKVTVVDCGVWKPERPDGGLATVEAGLQGAGYALADVSRVIITHAHIDHYGLAGEVVRRSGGELWMHRRTDLDLTKYEDPDEAVDRRMLMLADHGLYGPELTETSEGLRDWLPVMPSTVSRARSSASDTAS